MEDITGQISGKIVLTEKPSSESPIGKKEQIESGILADKLRTK